jgi:hypothetical protein
MFWKILSGTMRGSIMVSRTFTALGAATIITVAVYDYVKRRNRSSEYVYPPRIR